MAKWHMRAHAKRLSDGAFFVASHPGHPAFLGYWFKRVEKAPVGWREVGEVWAHHDNSAFVVI